MPCIPTLTEIRGAVHDAAEQTDRIEQRAMSLLWERGCMEGLTFDQQRDVEILVRDAVERHGTETKSAGSV